MKAALLHASVIVFLASLNAQADHVVRLTGEIESATTDAEILRAGDSAVILLTITSDGTAPLYGADLTVQVASSAVRIAGIEYAETFSRVIIDQPIDDAVLKVRSVRTQPKQGLNPSLGADGQPLPLAHVKLDVVGNTRLENLLHVKAVGAMFGVVTDRTEVTGDIFNLAESEATKVQQSLDAEASLSAPGEPELAQAESVQAAEVVLKIVPVGSDVAVTTLEPYAAYEVHYNSEAAAIDGYTFFAISDQTTDGLSGAQPPPAGPWSATGNFGFFDFTDAQEPVDAAGIAGEFYRTAMIGDDIFPGDTPAAGNAGHLCNFKTAGPGQIDLQLLMYGGNAETGAITESKTTASFLIEG